MIRRNLKRTIWFITCLVLASSCGSPTSLPIQQDSLRIPEENVTNISLLGEWRIYDVNAIKWATDSSKFAVAGKENRDDVNIFGVFVYDVNSFNRLWFSKTYVPFSLAFSPNNQVIAVPALGLTLLDGGTGNVIRKISIQDGSFGSQEVAFSPDGTKLLSLGTDTDYRITHIYVWDIQKDKSLGVLAEEGVAFDFELSGDGKYLVLGLRDIRKGDLFEQQVHLWNVQTKQQICNFNGAGPVTFSLDGKFIAVSDIYNQENVDLWDAKSCQFLNTLYREDKGKIYSMDISPDGKILAVGGGESFQLWDVSNHNLLFESDKLPNQVKILAFSPDGRFLLSKTDRTSIDDNAIITLWGVGR